jgi:hypothetical protein
MFALLFLKSLKYPLFSVLIMMFLGAQVILQDLLLYNRVVASNEVIVNFMGSTGYLFLSVWILQIILYLVFFSFNLCAYLLFQRCAISNPRFKRKIAWFLINTEYEEGLRAEDVMF